MGRMADVRDAQRADPPLGPEGGHRRVTRRRMVQDRVEGALVGGPGVEVLDAQAAGELPEDPDRRPRVARRVQVFGMR